MTRFFGLLHVVALMAFASIQAAYAGGLLGDVVNVFVPGAGTKLDDAHREIKNAIPPYKAIEEGATHVVNEALVQTTAPLLQEMIARSRDDALSAGVMPIPQAIRANLTGFVEERYLKKVRYRVGGGGDLSLQVNSIRYGEARAITLDYVVVFASVSDALYNPSLWAHELRHIEQFQSWGIKDFAIRYVRSYHSVERPAYEEETRYAAWVGVKNAKAWSPANAGFSSAFVNRPVSAFSMTSTTNICGTSVGTCALGSSAPVGTPCWCNTSVGPATGSLIPTEVAVSAPAAQQLQPQPIQAAQPMLSPAQHGVQPSFGLPSGYGMQVCGCWGPNPAPFVPEPRCASGNVRVNVCPGYCAPGHPLYAYVCS